MLDQAKDLHLRGCVQFLAIMAYSTKLPLTLHDALWLLTPALTARRLLFLSSRRFPGSTLLGFNGRKGGFTAPRP